MDDDRILLTRPISKRRITTYNSIELQEAPKASGYLGPAADMDTEPSGTRTPEPTKARGVIRLKGKHHDETDSARVATPPHTPRLGATGSTDASIMRAKTKPDQLPFPEATHKPIVAGDSRDLSSVPSSLRSSYQESLDSHREYGERVQEAVRNSARRNSDPGILGDAKPTVTFDKYSCSYNNPEVEGSNPGSTSTSITTRAPAAAPWTVQQGSYFVYGTSLPKPTSKRRRKGVRYGVDRRWDSLWSPHGGFLYQTTPWIKAALCMLLVANILFLFAFVTNGWGTLYVMRDVSTNVTRDVTPHTHSVSERAIEGNGSASRSQVSGADGNPVAGEEAVSSAEVTQEVLHYWEFGLWQCCRSSDGLCLGTRFPSTSKVIFIDRLYWPK